MSGREEKALLNLLDHLFFRMYHKTEYAKNESEMLRQAHCAPERSTLYVKE